jgi:glycosyltransferase involved in cell wall biosynthesis
LRYLVEYTTFFLAALTVVSLLTMRRRYLAVQVDNLPDSLVLTALVPRLRGVRVVFNMFELTPEMVTARFPVGRGRILVGVARSVERLATRWADHVIVVSEECFRRVRGRGVPVSKLSVVLNTTSLVPADRGLGAQPAGDAPFLVTHSTLVKRYGVDVAIRAFTLLRPAWPGLTLRVIGDGEQRADLERLAAELGVAGSVEFTGQLPWPETLAHVRTAAIGIVSVLADGYGEVLLPTKLLEYARLGVPAACSRLLAVEHYFPDDALAYFPAGDDQELAARLERLLRDREAAAAQAKRALEVVQGMRWEVTSEAYLRALGVTEAARAAQLSPA